jgi:hypothetical protein
MVKVVKAGAAASMSALSLLFGSICWAQATATPELLDAANVAAEQVQANALGVLPIAAAVIGVIFGISLGIGLLLRWVRRHAK